MSTTYLDAVNKVLKKLREPTVTTVNQNDYSEMIGVFVNEAKTEIENAWDWSALRTTYTVTTTASLFNYVLTDIGIRFRILDVWNDTDNFRMKEQTSAWMDQQFLLPTTVVTGSPLYWDINGVDSNGDAQVDIFPVPNGVYNLRFNVVAPEKELVNDADTFSTPADVIVLGAFSRALEERGQDGGNQNAEMRYRLLLADYIAIDSIHREGELTWGAV